MESFPEVFGHHRVTESWSLELPCQFWRRVEDGDLVLWRTGEPVITLWIAVWDHSPQSAVEVRDIFASETPADVIKRYEWEARGVLNYGYLMREDEPEGPRFALYAFCITDSDCFYMAGYFDEASSLGTVEAIWRTASHDAP